MIRTASDLEFGIRMELVELKPPDNFDKHALKEYSIEKWAWENLLSYVRRNKNLSAASILEKYLKRMDEMIFSASKKNVDYFLEAYDQADRIYDIIF